MLPYTSHQVSRLFYCTQTGVRLAHTLELLCNTSSSFQLLLLSSSGIEFWCPIFSVSRSVLSDSFWPHGLQPARLLCPWKSRGKNTGVGGHFLLQGIFPTQGSNPYPLSLLHCCCCCCQVASVVSDSVWPHRWQPTRLPHPRDSPGKNTGVGCYFLLQCMKVKSESEVAESCPTLSDPMDWGGPGSSFHGIFQARVLEWGAIAFSAAALQADSLPTIWLMSNFSACSSFCHYTMLLLESYLSFSPNDTFFNIESSAVLLYFFFIFLAQNFYFQTSPSVVLDVSPVSMTHTGLYILWLLFSSKLCPTLCNPMNCSPPGSSVHEIFQARILKWSAIFSSRGSSWPRDWTHFSCLVDSLPLRHYKNLPLLAKFIFHSYFEWRSIYFMFITHFKFSFFPLSLFYFIKLLLISIFILSVCI